jgi:hypothetical protein
MRELKDKNKRLKEQWLKLNKIKNLIKINKRLEIRLLMNKKYLLISAVGMLCFMMTACNSINQPDSKDKEQNKSVQESTMLTDQSKPQNTLKEQNKNVQESTMTIDRSKPQNTLKEQPTSKEILKEIKTPVGLSFKIPERWNESFYHINDYKTGFELTYFKPASKSYTFFIIQLDNGKYMDDLVNGYNKSTLEIDGFKFVLATPLDTAIQNAPQEYKEKRMDVIKIIESIRIYDPKTLNDILYKKDYNEIGADLANKTIKYIFGKNSVDAVIKTLGQPIKKENKPDFERWYFKNGVEIDYGTDNDQPVFRNYIYISNLSTIKTDRGIGIGSSKEDVLKAYKQEINPEINSDEKLVIVGENTGLILKLNNNKVESIYIATGAYSIVDDGFIR